MRNRQPTTTLSLSLPLVRYLQSNVLFKQQLTVIKTFKLPLVFIFVEGLGTNIENKLVLKPWHFIGKPGMIRRKDMLHSVFSN